MTIHYDNHAAAEAHLSSNGFKKLPSGRYYTHYCVATIHPVRGSEKVCVFYTET